MDRRKGATQFMGRVEARTKELLSDIKRIDIQAVLQQSEYHRLAASIIKAKTQSSPKMVQQGKSQEDTRDGTSASLQLEELATSIRKMLREKVVLSRELYNMLADSCEQFDEFVQGNVVCHEESEGYQFLQECLGNEEISAIILECQAKEIELMCVCHGKETSSAMIKCESKLCKGRWFHLKCVGIKQNRVPKGSWTCKQCLKEEKERPKEE